MGGHCKQETFETYAILFKRTDYKVTMVKVVVIHVNDSVLFCDLPCVSVIAYDMT